MITVGIDVGSLTTKTVIVENSTIIAHKVVRTGQSTYEAVTRAVEGAMSLTTVDTTHVDGYVSTGIGKGETPYANKQVTEVLCDVRGALFYYPSARTVIDMGAESVRVARCSANGRVIDFGLNDRCASGTGTSLDTIAKALELEVEEIGPLSLQAKEDIVITATCAVFAESEVVGLIARGKDKGSILSGITKSIASRIYGLANKVGISKDVIFIGGGANNIGISKSLANLIKQGLLIPESPQIVGAVGAALIAQERSEAG